MELTLTLTRTNLDATCTEGELSINGEFQCYTLEVFRCATACRGQPSLPASISSSCFHRLKFEMRHGPVDTRLRRSHPSCFGNP